jgi:hypothetical protein
MLLVLACLVIQAISATANATAAPTRHAHARAHGPHATAARILPPALNATAKRSRKADRALVARAKGVKRCVRANPKHPGRCKSARRALQRAGTRFAKVERNLARLASTGGKSAVTAKASTVSAAQRAPTLTVSGFKLSWNKVDGINTYVFVIKIPGQADRYGVLTGTSDTPPPVPGVTVKYSVRTTANGSVWATEKSITYPAAKAPEEVKVPVKAPEEVKVPVKAPEEVKAPEKVNTQAAPALIVSGQKLVWNAVPGVSTYVLATIAPGKTTQYSEVSGTSFTPPAVAGTTIKYGLRTAVEGALWATEVSISYPAVAPAPPPPVSEEGKGGGSAMLVGLDAGGWGPGAQEEVAGIVKTVRYEDGMVGETPEWTKLGVKSILNFAGPSSSSGIKSLNVASWVANAVSVVKANPGLAAVEILNEPSQSVWWGSEAGSATEAKAYVKLVEAVHTAFAKELGSYPPIIVYVQSTATGIEWGEKLWADGIAPYVNGVVVHPYPNGGRGEPERSVVEKAHTLSGLPVWTTEVGWNTGQATEVEQAAGIYNFTEWERSTGYVAASTVFNFRDYTESLTSEAWGVETHSGTKKKGWTALKEVAAKESCTVC